MPKDSYSPQTSELLTELTRKHKGINITVGMLRQNEMIFDAWNDNNEPISSNLPYDIGSLTKLFTTSLLTKNIADETIELNTGLNHYISGLPDRFYPTITQLATHTSGYPENLPFTKLDVYKRLFQLNKPDGFLHVNPFHGTLNDKEMLEILHDHIIQPKAYKFAYNNFAFGVLGYILGQFSHQTSYDAINDFIHHDLGLNDTRTGITVDMPGHDRKQNTTENWKWDNTDIISAAGSLASTASDLLLFAHAHLYNTPDYLNIAHQKYTDGNKKWDMGLGWRMDKISDIHWHDGNAGGFSCILMLDMKMKTASVILTNYGMLNLKEVGTALLSDGNNSKSFDKLVSQGATTRSI